jgi:hypothetical protein
MTYRGTLLRSTAQAPPARLGALHFGSNSGDERSASSLPFVSSPAYREAAQVNVTRVTVVDRDEPRASVRDGTQMARSGMGPLTRLLADSRPGIPPMSRAAGGPGGAHSLESRACDEDGADQGGRRAPSCRLTYPLHTVRSPAVPASAGIAVVGGHGHSKRSLRNQQHRWMRWLPQQGDLSMRRASGHGNP